MSFASDSRAARPSTFGRALPVPSSIVTRATVSTRSRLNCVTGSLTYWSLGLAAMADEWAAHAERQAERYRDGERRLPDAADPDSRQRQLTRMGNAAGGAGFALLMAGRSDEAAEWLHRAAERYRESIVEAPPGSWGRPIGAMKALVIAGDSAGAEEAARWALELGAPEAESPIGRYAGSLALLVLGRDGEALPLAASLRERDDFPGDVADALTALASADRPAYGLAVESVLDSFESRDEYLEDIPVADTVLVLQALAARRELQAELSSPLLPLARRARRMQKRGDDQRVDARILHHPRLLDELGDQLERLLRGHAGIDLRAAKLPLLSRRESLLDFLEHRLLQVAREA